MICLYSKDWEYRYPTPDEFCKQTNKPGSDIGVRGTVRVCSEAKLADTLESVQAELRAFQSYWHMTPEQCEKCTVIQKEPAVRISDPDAHYWQVWWVYLPKDVTIVEQVGAFLRDD